MRKTGEEKMGSKGEDPSKGNRHGKRPNSSSTDSRHGSQQSSFFRDNRKGEKGRGTNRVKPFCPVLLLGEERRPAAPRPVEHRS